MQRAFQHGGELLISPRLTEADQVVSVSDHASRMVNQSGYSRAYGVESRSDSSLRGLVDQIRHCLDDSYDDTLSSSVSERDLLGLSGPCIVGRENRNDETPVA
jgi:hypothetical protein